MSESTSSLLLTDRSQLSVTESETAALRHNYNTRSTVKLKSKQSTSSLTDDTTPSKRELVAETRKSTVARLEPFEELRDFEVMRRNYAVPAGICHEPYAGSWERVFRYVIIFFSIGSIVLICSYLGHSLSESQGSVDCVRKELNKFKSDMKDLKGEVQGMLTSRDQTNKKLEIIQELLTDLKKQNVRISDIGPRPSGQNIHSSSGGINDAIGVYDADKTGMTDFALESAGGAIVDIKDTQNYPAGDPVTFLGVQLCQPGNGPRTMLQPGTQPGECWAFKGSTGSAIIKLLGRVRLSGVSLEHIPKTMSPSGEISTAPKEFSIWGLENKDAKSGDALGTFVYKEDGGPLQQYPMTNVQKSYDYIEFKVHSNQGNPDFTCVYRLRVHGTLDGKRI